MIRAKRLVWEERKLTNGHVSKFGYFEYVVMPFGFKAGFWADLCTGEDCYWSVGETHSSLDAAKAACQAHADALAREIAEVDQ